MRSNIWNISKYGYIGILILRIYRKYLTKINEYFDKNMDQIEMIQNLWRYLENFLKNDKISKNIHIKIIL